MSGTPCYRIPAPRNPTSRRASRIHCLGVLVVIGGLGLVFERVIFQTLEARSVARWGMPRAVKA